MARRSSIKIRARNSPWQAFLSGRAAITLAAPIAFKVKVVLISKFDPNLMRMPAFLGIHSRRHCASEARAGPPPMSGTMLSSIVVTPSISTVYSSRSLVVAGGLKLYC
jgi:hypothetical protein